MNSIFKRALSLLLVFVMCISLVPASALAEGEESTEITSEQDVVEQLQEETAEDEQIPDETVEPTEVEPTPTVELIPEEINVSEDKTTETIPVENVIITTRESEFDGNLLVGESLQLYAKISPENATDKNVIWSNSNDAVAKVNEEGLVVAVAAGETVIKAEAMGISTTMSLVVYESEQNQGMVQSCSSGITYGNVKWTLNDGFLSLYAEDSTKHAYVNGDGGWSEFSDSIFNIYVGSGVDSIAGFAFANYSRLSSVYIGADVTSIGTNPFYNCKLLSDISVNPRLCQLQKLKRSKKYPKSKKIKKMAFSREKILAFFVPLCYTVM